MAMCCIQEVKKCHVQLNKDMRMHNNDICIVVFILTDTICCPLAQQREIDTRKDGRSASADVEKHLSRTWHLIAVMSTSLS